MSRNSVNHPYGDQLLKVAIDEVRGLGLMPRDVEILGFLTPQEAGVNYWNDEAHSYCYVHIKCSISFDRSSKAPLCIEPLFAFYDRYVNLRKAWADDLASDVAFYNQTYQAPRKTPKE